VGIMISFQTNARIIAFDQLWNHSWATGVLAKSLAEIELGDAHVADQAFLGGLLHDVGKLVLATGLAEEYAQVVRHQRRQRLPLGQAELELLGATHAEVGAYLLGLWGMPTPLVEAVALHHRPTVQDSPHFTLATALHVANGLLHEHAPGPPGSVPSQLDMGYLAQLELHHRVRVWRHELHSPHMCAAG
jgi:putative nucleotidyltransferase with HDIG domain